MLCKVVTFNLHGLNNGKDMLYQICDDDDVLIVAVQELIGLLTINCTFLMAFTLILLHLESLVCRSVLPPKFM